MLFVSRGISEVLVENHR